MNCEQEYRNYRVSRILDVNVLDRKFKRSNEFVLADYWKESKERFIQNLPEYQVEVEVTQNIMNRIMFTGRFVRLINTTHDQQDSHWIPVSMSFPTEEEAINFILGFGNQIKVTDPSYLQEELKFKANGILDLYRE